MVTSRRSGWLAGIAAAAMAWGGAAPALAGEAKAARIAALETQLAALQEQIADLKASTAANIQVLRDDQKATSVSIAGARPTFTSGDGQFTAALRGVFQLDAAIYDQAAPGPLASDFRRGSFGDATENERARDLSDGANFRRARLGIEGRAFGALDYNFLYDFGGSGTEDGGKISAAWVQYAGLPLANAKLRVGAFSPPAGIEEATSTNGSLFAERASPSEVVRSIASGDGRTALGLLANGERWNASAAISGNVIGNQTYDEQVGFVGRLAWLPVKGLDYLVHVGANTSVVIEPAKGGPDLPGVTSNLRLRDRPELRVDPTRLVDTGNIDSEGLKAFGVELAAQYKAFHLQAEYFDIAVERVASSPLPDPKFNGWYVQGAYTLTGQPRRYNIASATFDAPKGDKPFDWRKGDWGVWELAARYSDLDLNYLEGAAGAAPVAGAIRGGEQQIWTLGLNWYVNPVLRFQAAYQDVSVDRLSPGGTAFGAAPATPAAGAQVGQDLNIWSLRTQFAF